MSALSEIVDVLVSRIASVPDVGRVFDHDPWHRDDLSEQLVAEIDGVPFLRAWWIRGPMLSSRWVSADAYTGLFREWTFDIEGIEGLAPNPHGDDRPPGGDIVTIRDNAQAVCDAIDVDHNLGLDGVFSAKPCAWSQMPEHVVYTTERIAASHVVIQKTVVTFVGPH